MQKPIRRLYYNSGKQETLKSEKIQKQDWTETMKFFRMTAALACAAALFAAAGCGKKQDDGKIKVAISIPSADHGWTGGVVWWAEQVKREMEAKEESKN